MSLVVPSHPVITTAVVQFFVYSRGLSFFCSFCQYPAAFPCLVLSPLPSPSSFSFMFHFICCSSLLVSLCLYLCPLPHSTINRVFVLLSPPHNSSPFLPSSLSSFRLFVFFTFFPVPLSFSTSFVAEQQPSHYYHYYSSLTD